MQTVSKWAWLISLFAMAMLLVAACGGGDDDDGGSGDDDDDDSGAESSGSSRDAKDLDFPEFKAGNYTGGKVHLQVSGDEDQTFDVDGNGIGTDGFANLAYLTGNASIVLTFINDKSDGPGAVSITTDKFATAGEWGKDCDVSVKQSSGGIEGDFECKGIDGLKTGTVKGLKLNLKGTFTATK
jgi:hypothetical protein